MVDGCRIAMWSGPRNISTAMMYSFENRNDCCAIDEPFYAHYLEQTGVEHPGAQKVIDNYETDYHKITQVLSGEFPEESGIWYQKHMCHHIPLGADLDWIQNVTNCFLIRDPREVLLSLSKITHEVSLWATGLPQQIMLLERALQDDTKPPILDSRDILENPREMLGMLCHQLDIQFSESMLSWEAGPRDCDGIWGEYWYESVWSSTGFSPYSHRTGELSPSLESVLEDAMPLYLELHSKRIRL